MSTRYERIKSLIEQSGLSYQELEKATGIKKSSLQRYASGTTTKIPLDAIEKLSKTFNVSQEYLMGWSDNKKINTPEKSKLSEGEKMWLELDHKLSNTTRDTLVNILVTSLDEYDELSAEQQQLALDLIRVVLKNKK